MEFIIFKFFFLFGVCLDRLVVVASFVVFFFFVFLELLFVRIGFVFNVSVCWIYFYFSWI